MARYKVRAGRVAANYDWPDEYPMLPDVQVHDFDAINTGLLDANGDEIWREPNPIGFGRDEEWG